jgi:hypothetical protein
MPFMSGYFPGFFVADGTRDSDVLSAQPPDGLSLLSLRSTFGDSSGRHSLRRRTWSPGWDFLIESYCEL